MRETKEQAIERLKKSDAVFIYAKDIAPIFGSDPQDIRILGQNGELRFELYMVGNRMKILRTSFLAWLRASGMAV